ncbi:MAG: thiamine pyrophosphate-dependent enzyme [Pseudonocardiaceae bacterium]
MGKTAGDYLCERLLDWGVSTIYGFPGDGINGILGALRRYADRLRFIQTRHEEMAAFMACGHAKFTGEVGVCMATSGPGAIHLLNGLYDAGRMLSIRYPMDLALVGDSKQTLAELLPLLHRKTDRSWQEGIVTGVADWWRLMDDRARPADIDRDGDRPRVRPQALFAELSRQLPDNAVLSSDSGSAANWFGRQVKIRRGMKASLSGNLATMVPGVPYAIAAKFALPDRVSVAMVGDGAMQMGGMAELLTAAKYYKTWADPRLVVLILNNEDLNQVTWEQRAMAGDPKFHASQDIPYVPYHAYAEMIGLRGIKVERSAQIEGAWREALSSDPPVIIDAMTDPEEPPIPPHVSFAQMEAMAKAFVAAPKEGLPGALSAVREFAHEFLPGR